MVKLSKLQIVKFGDPVLRETAKPVTVVHKKTSVLINSMKYTLSLCNNGAAVAANQVGVAKRITVIDYEGEQIEMINPEILYSEGENIDYEGCLSYPEFFGKVPRFEKVKVKYLDRNLEEKIIERTGNLARCIQHEIDHLNGILFIDRMKEKLLTHSETSETIELEKVMELSNKF
jgi:peptide deformylase